MSSNRRSFLAAAGAVAIGSSAMAQTVFPSRPIRLVVPSPVGSPGDIVSRVLAERMGQDLKSAFVIENRPTATGAAVVPEVLRMPADGTTIYYLGSTMLINPLLYPSMNLDYVRDFVSIGGTTVTQSVLVVSAGSRFNNVQDIVREARARADELTYASPGSGFPPHLAAELFKQKSATKIRHIPYVQLGQALTDVISARVDMMFLGIAVAMPQIRAGKLKAIAMAGSTRSRALPEVPTIAEAGLAGYSYISFEGMLVKRGTPDAIVQRLADSLSMAKRDPTALTSFGNLGLETLDMSALQFGQYYTAEADKLIAFAKEIGIRAE